MKSVNNIYRIGVDVGSTTLKIVILNQQGEIIYKVYKRHQANFNEIFSQELSKIANHLTDGQFSIAITGSAGMGISERTGIEFVQEVVSAIEVIKKLYPQTHTMIDLGGEDAKMVFFEADRQPDIRMNGSCAGGTGAFIDQMADLMNISIEELGKQALRYETLYPVASRCGVFAKTDIQNLIARNVPIPDISKSILHAVAVQSITTLARGYDITPQIICTGGPLTFLPALRDSFIQILELRPEDMTLPENSEYFPALGVAMLCDTGRVVDSLVKLIGNVKINNHKYTDTLPPLFIDRDEYNKWLKNRSIRPLKMRELKKGDEIECFLGIDAGSTTTKILIMDSHGAVIYTHYAPNRGNTLRVVTEGLQKFYTLAKEQNIKFRFISSAATGYGEDLVRSALNLDFGIVETMAHLAGAQYVDPNVSFVLDIGGQDMKSIFTREGVISNVELNEACSSGCGSFLQNFAATMNMTLSEFTEAACNATYPSDLGSRCTVFMNSKVKQSLRENAGLGDIAAGLAYSVVKNCLFKVLKISNLNELGDHIVVQGGTFRNDAVYRALELLSGKQVSSTDHPELMGALGAALYAEKLWKREPYQTAFAGNEPLLDVDNIHTEELNCRGCNNSCSVLRFKFDNNNICYAGNKCEKFFFSKESAPIKGENSFDQKNHILFDHPSKSNGKPPRARIGIPRVLNMFENYPFWHKLLTECGFEVVLSPESTFALYQRGVNSVMSDNICFPAKLVHGHIVALSEMGVNRIFYPIVPKEGQEFSDANNSFNCPVVSGYPDVVRSSMEPEESYGIPFDKPVITFSDQRTLLRQCTDYLSSLGVDSAVAKRAFNLAIRERIENIANIISPQRKLLERAVESGELLFVVAGRPYHTDPLVHQKVGQILSDLGVHVVTDDIFRNPTNNSSVKGNGVHRFAQLNVISQWSYPNRVVNAAMEVAKLPPNIQLIQLNSFGCGPDSFLMDEVQSIMRKSGKNLTILRIDEIASPGSIRLRLRSLIESLKAIEPINEQPSESFKGYSTSYTKSDRKKTILAPWFADFISPFIPALGEIAGYKIINLPKPNKSTAEVGLKYGHNEVCYPSTLVLGDIIFALKSGEYDLDDIVVAITQTGGQCRATNYVAQIKQGLENAGFSGIPVVVMATGKVYQNEQSAFKLPVIKMFNIIINTLLYGDALQQMLSSTIVREKIEGETQQLFDRYVAIGIKAIQKNSSAELLKRLEDAVAEFNSVEISQREFTPVGLVGEIYVKYNDYGQADIRNWLRKQGMEVVTPPILDFFTQYLVNSQVNRENGVGRGSAIKNIFTPVFSKYMDRRIGAFERRIEKFRFHRPQESIYTKARYASDILDLSNQFGEGWAIAGEVACFSRQGIDRVVCLQPFGCIANHIVAKGIEKRLKKFYPKTSMLYLDIDDGVAEVNLQNRLHFLID